VALAVDVTQRIAVEAQKARLLEEVRASREELRALSRRLVAIQEAERSYVADQLYNQAGQVLAALQLQLARLRKDGAAAANLPEIDAILNEAMRELHDLAAQLRPVGLDRSTLAQVLRSYANEFVQKHSLSMQFRPGNADGVTPPAEVSTAVFRAVQEGLANIARHAKATQVDLSLSRDSDALTVTLSDNGVGFDLENASGAAGLGLAGMRERLEAVGGLLMVTSGAAGTTLHMRAPLYHGEKTV
jgi:two-component system NarL family sensor kinase